jgi:hypothetical protein
MADEVFSSEAGTGFTITYGRRCVRNEEGFSLDAVKRFAAEQGVRNFTATGGDGRRLGSRDFPYRGNITMSAYNAPKQEGEVFQAEGPQRETEYTISVGNTVKARTTGSWELDAVKRVAAECGVRNFTIESSDGRKLGSRDFPLFGNVVLRQYNAPK